jgi:hypothetical protein
MSGNSKISGISLGNINEPISKTSGNGSQGAPSTFLSHASDLEDRLHEVDGATNFSDGELLTTAAIGGERINAGKLHYIS